MKVNKKRQYPRQVILRTVLLENYLSVILTDFSWKNNINAIGNTFVMPCYNMSIYHPNSFAGREWIWYSSLENSKSFSEINVDLEHFTETFLPTQSI